MEQKQTVHPVAADAAPLPEKSLKLPMDCGGV